MYRGKHIRGHAGPKGADQRSKTRVKGERRRNASPRLAPVRKKNPFLTLSPHATSAWRAIHNSKSNWKYTLFSSGSCWTTIFRLLLISESDCKERRAGYRIPWMCTSNTAHPFCSFAYTFPIYLSLIRFGKSHKIYKQKHKLTHMHSIKFVILIYTIISPLSFFQSPTLPPSNPFSVSFFHYTAIILPALVVKALPPICAVFLVSSAAALYASRVPPVVL